MALDKGTLKSTLIALFTDMETKATDGKEEFAERLSNAIEEFVKSGNGIYQAGTLVAGATTVTGVGTVIKIV
jgi:hypothetical protein